MKGLCGISSLGSSLGATAPAPLPGGSGVTERVWQSSADHIGSVAWQRLVEKLLKRNKEHGITHCKGKLRGQSHKVPIHGSYVCPWELGTLCNLSLVPWVTEPDCIARSTVFKPCKVLRLTFQLLHRVLSDLSHLPRAPGFNEDSHGWDWTSARRLCASEEWDLTFPMCQKTQKVEH